MMNDGRRERGETEGAIETLIAEALRRKAFDEVLSNADRVEAPGIPPMLMEQINAEIDAYWAARRRAG